MQGEIVLVLDNGMSGEDFVALYDGQTIKLMSSIYQATGIDFAVTNVCCTYVWYPVLVGDERLWVTNTILNIRVKGTWDWIEDKTVNV